MDHEQTDPEEYEGYVAGSGRPKPRIETRIVPDEAGFETALLQLQALGLVMPGIKKRGVNDHRTYWTLTPWGGHGSCSFGPFARDTRPEPYDADAIDVVASEDA